MCGIIAAFNKDADANEEVLLQFEDQSSRGTNGFGSIFLNEEGDYSIQRSCGQVKAIIDVKLQPSKMIIFHHRMPSSSKNKISQTHPIRISGGDLKFDYYIVHNGVIQNEDERKKIHNEEFGYMYSTEVETEGWYGKKETMFNDSETLGYDMARFIEGYTDKIETVGSAAFIMTQVDKATDKVVRIFFGRNSGNPLKMSQNKKSLFLSSEGKGELIPIDTLYEFKPDNWKMKKRKFDIKTSKYAYEQKEEKETKHAVVTHVGYQDSVSKERKFDDDDDDDYGTYNGVRSMGKDYPIDGDEWLSYQQEELVDGYIAAAVDELENLQETIKEARSDEVFLLDAKAIIKVIALNVHRAVSFAQTAKADVYLAEGEAEAAEAIAKGEEGETLTPILDRVIAEKFSSK